ncbi:MiaB/RimO family radical SAM methylthiotransferase [Sphingomonas sp.]|jgi:threonylcarbamoyladenosine tRNA methylthiotransferase MtaB|uniref:MiaB/RimO family radical SAM methylthiotransferase n=1 Tax=Sphingomonas sp. TaxID=28214 RepID=UPI002D7F5A9A|nr:radical SAM protein [Sphingomonas sp.]HEU0043544.1 radical SAM protein [Sphingomonas sp.]
MQAPSPVVSLGCRLNIAESDAIAAMLGANGLGRDVAVVNSCAVTGEAVKQSRAAVRRLRRARPGAELIVTGCAATIDPAGFAGLADRVVSNAAKLLPTSWGATRAITPMARHARAFVPVQNGCDHACTFCIIPQGRGASVSAPVEQVVARVGALVAAGHREIVLTGVDLTSYAPALGPLCERLLRDTGVERLRLSSVDGHEIDPVLFELLASEPRMMPHLHLSLQAGNDLILKRMKRRHSRADAVALVARLKMRRDVAVGADLIAGFPTETEAMFADTLALLDDCDIVHAHIFPFSPREGTPAARMPQVALEVRRARAARLREAAAERKARWLGSLVGTVQDVLVEKPGDRGHSPQFAEVRVAPATVGSVQRVTIDRLTDGQLSGTAQ